MTQGLGRGEKEPPQTLGRGPTLLGTLRSGGQAGTHSGPLVPGPVLSPCAQCPHPAAVGPPKLALVPVIPLGPHICQKTPCPAAVKLSGPYLCPQGAVEVTDVHQQAQVATSGAFSEAQRLTSAPPGAIINPDGGRSSQDQEGSSRARPQLGSRQEGGTWATVCGAPGMEAQTPAERACRAQAWGSGKPGPALGQAGGGEGDSGCPG